jgi:diacylglycerol kinase (ATP)
VVQIRHAAHAAARALPIKGLSVNILVLTNKASGSADDQALVDIEKGLAPLGDVEHFSPSSKESLDEETRAAVKGKDLVVIAAGDGTVNCVLNALGDSLDPHTFAVIPMGTGNDFARTLGMPDDPGEAASAIANGRETEVDYGKASGGGVTRLFLNACMGGFPTAVDEAVEGKIKKLFGPLAFWVGGVKAATDFSTSLVNVGGTRIDACVAVGVGNGRTAGGGIQVWPDADPGDGELDVCAISAPSITKALAIAAKTRSGEHVNRPEVFMNRTHSVRIEADPEVEFNVDGELVGLKTPAEFLVAGGIKLRVPA